MKKSEEKQGGTKDGRGGKYNRNNQIPVSVVEAMQRDRDAGMLIIEIARKYGVSKPTVCRITKRKVEVVKLGEEILSEDWRQKLQQARDAGFTLPEITEEYGVSYQTAAANTHEPRRYQFPRNGMIRERTETKTPITKAEIAAIRANLHPGEMRVLIVTYCDEEKMIQRKVKECCVVEHVSRHVVVFRRPGGRLESRTLIELCQAERMERGY